MLNNNKKLTNEELAKLLLDTTISKSENGTLTLELPDHGWGHTKNKYVRSEARDTAARLVTWMVNESGLPRENFTTTISGLIISVEGANDKLFDGLKAVAASGLAAEEQAKPNEIFLKDYTPPSHLIDKTDLTFELNAPDQVVVSSKLTVKANPESKDDPTVIRLDAAPETAEDESPTLKVLEVKVNGKTLKPSEYTRDGGELVIPNLPASGEYTIETKSQIDPQANKSGIGLYMSGKFTTQCESQGFRNMTPYIDRPDLQSEFTTTIIAPKGLYPQLLSNGNAPTDGIQETADGRDTVTWHDPHRKPAYLFALVAGDMDVLSDKFTTMSGKEVDLNIYCDKGDREKLHHAMDSIKKSMKWDEERFGREYDLDTFNIVAVNDFNFGAMENKGLNIFNASAVLADPKTASDARYEYIQAVVGHEYFHNWSGDRVTLRDWFQLSLKEGFTVFRDAEFTADLNSRDVKRIDDAVGMRTAQFPEDAGAMAHPIRPSSFVSIENFYTPTVYEKGKEVIGMMHTLVGEEAFRAGTDIYFDRHDGTGATTEDFVKAISDGAKSVGRPIDLSQFEKTWYNQAGTPVLDVTDSYDPKTKEYKLTIKQSVPTHPQNDPYHIPVKIGLLDSKGNDIALDVAGDPAQLTNGDVLNLKEGEQTFVFKNVPEKPLPSLLRNWSAPVKVNYDYSRDDLTFLMSNDSDGFNRWDAGQTLAVDVLKELVEAHQKGENKEVDPRLISAYKAVLNTEGLDPALAAQTLSIPSSTYLSELYPDGQVDVDAIYAARKQVREAIGKELEPELKAAFDANRSTENRPYQWNHQDAGERAIKNTALAYLTAANPSKYLGAASEQLKRDQNATDNNTALSLIVNYADAQTRDAALDKFYQDNKENPLIVNSWLSQQASADRPDILDHVKALTKSPAYPAKNANAIRALVGGFAGNLTAFHAKDGSGYAFLADQVIEIAKFNEMVAAGLTKRLANPHRFDETRQELMREQLERIGENVKSKQVQEIVSKSLELLDKKQAEARGNGSWADRVAEQDASASVSRAA